ncbi:MAG: hypothetical protein ACOVP4_04730 [Bacteriovoracaceae bacterium]
MKNTIQQKSLTDAPKMGDAKNVTQTISLIVGIALFILGLCGLLFPAFMGLHLSLIHSLIIGSAGVTLLWNGYKVNAVSAYITCLGFGIFFGLHALAGFLFGQPGIPTVGYTQADTSLLTIIPNFQELGLVDHILNAVIAILLLAGAYDWKRTHSS